MSHLRLLSVALAATLPMLVADSTLSQDRGITVKPGLLDKSSPSLQGQGRLVRPTGPRVLAPPEQQQPGVVYATTSIKCGNTVYEVSTGNKAGGCSVAGPAGGQIDAANCEDTSGNKASANCQTGCGTSSGSGSCTIKSAD